MKQGLTSVEYENVKRTIQQGDLSIVTDELIENIARFKFYKSLWNADDRVNNRESYKDIQYLLGEYTKGFDYMKVHKKELHEKLLTITKNYIYNNLNRDFAPQIHRELRDYSWDTIDILPEKEHKEIDTKNSKATIVRGHFTNNELIPKSKAKPLTKEELKKIAGGKQFSSITKAKEYIKSGYGFKGNIDKVIDTAEKIKTKVGSFEVFKVENKEIVRCIKLAKVNEMISIKFPRVNETMNSIKSLISTTEGKNALKLWLEK